MILSSVAIVISTLLMEPKSEGMGSLSGSETNVFGKSASKGKEALLSRITVVSSVIFAVSTVLVSALS